MLSFHLSLDEWLKPILQQFKGLANAFMICDSHLRFLSEQISLFFGQIDALK
jgi:hypothetical protein